MKRLLPILVAVAVGWWLFADTVAHHWPADDGGTIRFAHFGGYDDFQLWRRIIDDFEAANPDVRVRHEFVPGWYGHYETKMRQQILTGTLPDVVLVQMGPFASIARHLAPLDLVAGGLMGEDARLTQRPRLGATGPPLPDGHGSERRRGFTHGYSDQSAGGDAVETDLLAGRPFRDDGRSFRSPSLDADDLDRGALDAFTIDIAGAGDRLRALPVSGGNLAIYCNPDCFARASDHHGRPVEMPSADWTVEDFARVARDLTIDFDGDGALDQWGLWPPGWVYLLPFIWSFGAELTDPTGRQWALIGPAAEQMFDYWRRLVRDDRVCPSPADVPQLIQDVGFLTGKVGMSINGPWFQPFLNRTDLRDRYTVLPVPRGPAGRFTRITWDALAIADRLPGNQRHAAWRFVCHCMSLQTQRAIASTGRALPVRRDALPQFLAPGGSASASANRRAFVDALEFSRLQPRLEPFAPLDRSLRARLHDYLRPGSMMTAAHFLAAVASDPSVAAIGTPPTDRPSGDGQ